MQASWLPGCLTAIRHSNVDLQAAAYSPNVKKIGAR
jgi:hypothetical protein